LGFTSTIFIFQNEKPHFRLLKTGFIDNLKRRFYFRRFRVSKKSAKSWLFWYNEIG